MSRNINYFDLGAHTGTEITTFLWHINFLRKNTIIDYEFCIKCTN